MYLQVKVTPKSRVTEFNTWLENEDGKTAKIRLTAAPEKGKANEELIKFLAESCKVSKDKIKIISGHTSQIKLMKIPDNTLLPW